jgi:diguanylate cyclase (GGDEF)-like protein
VDQELAAVVELLSPERREVDAEFIEAAMEGAAQLGRVVERIRTRDHNAMHDPLTNLPNRNLFMNYVRQAIRRLRPGSGLVAVMFIDLDNFKQINDNLGHEVGDRVLTTIADRFAGTVRRGDIVGRFGGDEFLVLCEQVPLVEPLVEIAARLVKVVAEPVFLDGGSAIVVSGSVGVAVATSPEMTAEDLVRDADAAMYRAKQEGPGRMQISATGETTVAAGRTSDAN